MYSVRDGEQPWGTTRNEDRHERGRRMAANVGADEGGADHLGEKRERKRRENDEEAGTGLSFSLVMPNGLVRLSHTICFGTTEAQVAHGK
jgi:hypothetical protein